MTINNLQISIIIPVYNTESFLTECIDSILAQTYTAFEIIIINDGSTDNSPQICNAYAAKYKNITILHSDNEGVSSARNKGINIARGEYILFVDGDDILYPNCLQTFSHQFNQHYDIIIGGSDIIYHPDKQAHRYYREDYNSNSITENFQYYVNGRYIITPWNKLIRRDFLINNNLYFQKGIIHEDELWSFRVLMYCNSLKSFSTATYIYRIRPNSITTSAKLKYRADSLFQITKLLYNEILYMDNKPSSLIISYETMKNKCMRAIIKAYPPKQQYDIYCQFKGYRLPLLRHIFSKYITFKRVVSYIHYLCPTKIGFYLYKTLLHIA